METLQEAMNALAPSLGRTVGFADEHGVILASTDNDLVGTRDAAVREYLTSGKASAGDERTYRAVTHDGHALICFVEGIDATAHGYVELLARWLEAEIGQRDAQVLRGFEHRHAFLKNVLLENELPGDIPLKARAYGVPYHGDRLVLLFQFSRDDYGAVFRWLETKYGDDDDNFVLPMDERNIAVLKAVDEVRFEDRHAMCEQLVQSLRDDVGVEVKLGVSAPAKSLSEAARSYKEAALAMTVGEIFYADTSSVMHYEKLGLGRLIYQLPITLCEMFLSEVFAPGTYEALDKDTLETIDKFFENSLNGSETSRQLFIHRNTLVYRLDKIEKVTGLDLRTFEDAVLFKLADMVRAYLEYVAENKRHTLDGMLR